MRGLHSGLPISAANFRIAALPGRTEPIGRLFFNPPDQGQWLVHFTGPFFRIGVHDGNGAIESVAMEATSSDPGWPVSTCSASSPVGVRTGVCAETWAPLAGKPHRPPFAGFAPVVFTAIACRESPSAELEITCGVVGRNATEESSLVCASFVVRRDRRGALVATVVTHPTIRGFETVAHAKASVMRLLHDPRTSIDATRDAARAHLYDRIPHSAPAAITRLVATTVVPALVLTKLTRSKRVVTMGYAELNQRDSYWTSWFHLIATPELERRMILQSATAQRSDGKIPTCIEPVIDRTHDVDPTCFFILRALRWRNLGPDTRGDRVIGIRAVRRAARWLIERTDGSAIPRQIDYWMDWKDVPGVDGRRYSPYAAFLYIAALRAAAKLASEDSDLDARTFAEAADRAARFVDQPIEDGGLWNGSYYEQAWSDGHRDARLLQDQVVGIAFDVVAKDRALLILTSLRERSWTPWGTSETSPPYGAEFGYEPGTYHNGGVWPWLNAVETWSRYLVGDRDGGDELARRTYAAVGGGAERLPFEFYDARTGMPGGVSIQGWNAAWIGALILGRERHIGASGTTIRT